MAFVLPVIKSFLDEPNKKKRVHAIILSPTNVLAQQIYVQFLKFAADSPIRVALLEPGVPTDDGKCFTASYLFFTFLADILVTTPYKFIFSLKRENLTANDLSAVRWLILDEADRLFETTEGERNFRLQVNLLEFIC